MAQYDDFADFYNRSWGEEYHAQLIGILDALLLHDLRPGDSILDVGCGTGTAAARLVARDFVVTGIDQSEAMLAFARVNAPGASFKQADAASFQFDSPFTATIATFEAMNHLLSEVDLERSFRCIAQATTRCFVFDMNGETAFDVFWNGDYTVEHDGLACALHSRYDPVTRIATCRTAVGGLETEIRERFYDAETVERLLKRAGFPQVRRFDARRDLGMWGDASLGRNFYQCYR